MSDARVARAEAVLERQGFARQPDGSWRSPRDTKAAILDTWEEYDWKGDPIPPERQVRHIRYVV